MSKFSGKCDLYDHVFIIGCKGTNDQMSELEKFNVFKERTGGVLHQNRRLVLEKHNIDYEIEYINNPNVLRKEKINGRWRYFYYGKKFTSLDTLNKYGYYTDFQIHFDSIIDLIPYYPYVITMMVSDIDSEYICLSSTSHVDSELIQPWRKVNYGKDSIHNYYKEKLREELIRVVKEYY